MSRIKATDNIGDVVWKMCEGNPGAMNVALAMIQEDFHLLLMCDTIGLYGSKLYMFSNDCCGDDMQKVKNVIRAWQRGEISSEEIHEHLAGGYGRPFDTINKPEGKEAAK